MGFTALCKILNNGGRFVKELWCIWEGGGFKKLIKKILFNRIHEFLLKIFMMFNLHSFY